MDDKKELDQKLKNIKLLSRYSKLAAISLILFTVLTIILGVYIILFGIAQFNTSEILSFDYRILFILIPIGIFVISFIVFLILAIKYKKLIKIR